MFLQLRFLSFTSVLTLVALSAGAVLSASGAVDPQQAELDALIASTKDPAQKSVLQAHSAVILAACTKKAHIGAVVATLVKASGTYEIVNTTPDAIKQAFGRDVSLFDTLKFVNLSNTTLGIKGKRTEDPFDHAFYEHLGEISDLESFTILNTTAHNEDLIPVAKLKNRISQGVPEQS